MKYSDLLKETYLLFGAFITSHLTALIFMFYIVNVRQLPPLLAEISPALFYLAFAIAAVGLILGQYIHNQKIDVVGALESPEQKVIIFRKALFYRLIFWDIAAIWVALLYALTGNITIFVISFAFIPLLLSSIPSLVMIKDKLKLSDRDIENMRFLREKKRHSFSRKPSSQNSDSDTEETE
ncbi:MAG: hypothetical protein ACOCWH_07155 [Spirochaetota bacterium]